MRWKGGIEAGVVENACVFPHEFPPQVYIIHIIRNGAGVATRAGVRPGRPMGRHDGGAPGRPGR